MMKTTRTIQTQAPTRIDLGGGTLDIWPLARILQEKYELWNSPIQTLNVAIDLYASAEVCISDASKFEYKMTDLVSQQSETGSDLSNKRAIPFPLHRAAVRTYRSILQNAKVTVSTNAMAPKGSGLGGSSSVVVALLAAFQNLLHGADLSDASRHTLCLQAQNLEAGILGSLAGNQDHFAAAYGGVQALCHDVAGSWTQAIHCNGSDLLEHIVLAHSGIQHFSAFNNWLILEKVLTGNTEVLSKCADIAQITKQMIDSVRVNQWGDLADLMSREWRIRKSLADGISSPILDNMYATAMASGAAGGKVCGAGGGGVLVMLLPNPSHRQSVETAISAMGGQILKAGFAATGVSVINGIKN